jgi:hypothetical protein
MKKIKHSFILLFLLPGWSSFAQAVENAGNNTFTIIENTDQVFRFKSNFQRSSIDVTTVATTIHDFSELTIDGFGNSNTVGEPKLPVLKQLIEVPLEATFEIKLINFTVKEYTLAELGMNAPIVPEQGPISKSSDPSTRTFKYNKDIYATNAFLDRQLIEVIPVGIMRGVRVARVEIAPVLYNPVENKLKIYENIEVEITYKNADLVQTRELKEKTYSPYFEASYNMFANHTVDIDRGNFTRYPVKYVIVSDPMFKAALQPFISWKIKKGFKVIEAYTNDAKVGTTTTTIQKYLKDLYTSGTAADPAPSFVLFVGDVAQIPAYKKTEHVTDLYYCEYTGDKLPEVYYGRFSATTVAQLQPQVDKTLEYEQYLMPDPSFLNNAVLIAGVDDEFAPKHGNGQINYAVTNYFNASNKLTTSTYLYPASGSSATKIIQNVNTGACFVNYTAHGSPSGWANPSFSTSKVPSLTNLHKYPLMVGNCCLTNKFEVAECFGEALLRAKDKGAIGYIGASNSSTWNEDYWFGVGYRSSIVLNPKYSATQLGCYDRAFHTHGEAFGEWYTTQGQILNAGNLAVTQSGSSVTYYWEIYHLMGDPSLMPYFSVPSKMPVDYTSPASASITTVNIKTEAYAYVAISLKGVLYGVALADANGIASIKLDKKFSAGDVADVVATKQNRQPFSGKLVIDNSTGIANLNTNNSLNIFPNPSNDVFTMEGLGIGNRIEIFDMVGKLIYETTSKDISVLIDLKEQKKGVYFYKVVDPSTQKTATGKLLLF